LLLGKMATMVAPQKDDLSRELGHLSELLASIFSIALRCVCKVPCVHAFIEKKIDAKSSLEN
jgi:hypothetical protein